MFYITCCVINVAGQLRQIQRMQREIRTLSREVRRLSSEVSNELSRSIRLLASDLDTTIARANRLLATFREMNTLARDLANLRIGADLDVCIDGGAALGAVTSRLEGEFTAAMPGMPTV